MKTVHQWLAEYSISHRHPANKTLHWICVPWIVFSIFGLLRLVPVGNEFVNIATLGAVGMLLYYAMLSWRLTLGMVPAFLLMAAMVEWSFHSFGAMTHAIAMVAIFVLAWIGQFIGHHMEGAKPSFLKDLQFLLIGPLWLLADVYRRFDLSLVARAT